MHTKERERESFEVNIEKIKGGYGSWTWLFMDIHPL